MKIIPSISLEHIKCICSQHSTHPNMKSNVESITGCLRFVCFRHSITITFISNERSFLHSSIQPYVITKLYGIDKMNILLTVSITLLSMRPPNECPHETSIASSRNAPLVNKMKRESNRYIRIRKDLSKS